MDSAFDFVAQRRGQAIQLRKDGASFIIRGETLNMQLLGVNPHPKVQGAQELPDKRHYFIGSDRTRWATNVTAYSAVEYRDIYGGVDMIYRDSDTLEYDFVVHPGSDPRSIRFRFDGAAGVGRDGELLVRTQHTEIHHHRPIAYQIVDGAKRTVDARFEAFNEDEIGFEVGDYDTSKTLILDPVVVMSSYLGGSRGDVISEIATDAVGNIYVVGTSGSEDFPAVGPLRRTPGFFSNFVFVAKLNPEASSILYTAILSGGDVDETDGKGIAADSQGNVYITGSTTSARFPVVNPIQPKKGGFFYADAFVTKISPDGSQLIYSTYLGGTSHDVGRDIAVDGAGNAYILGSTRSTDFPTANAIQPKNKGSQDLFVTKLNASGSALVYSTYIGGSGDEAFIEGTQYSGHFGGITVDLQGNAYAAADTQSADFPVKNPFQSKLAGGRDLVVFGLDPTGALSFATYLGGSKDETHANIAIDPGGAVYVTGRTLSPDFPTLNAVQSTFGGFQDAFVAKLSPAGNSLVFSTYLGGTASDEGGDLVVDANGSVYVTGTTASPNFPTMNPLQTTFAGGGSNLTDGDVEARSSGGTAFFFDIPRRGAE